ncbi:MAG: putative peptide maturation dehydrogenase, partial [Pseudomonadota bacterium]
MAETTARYGQVPPPFHQREDALASIDLPPAAAPRGQQPLQRVLARRTTCRSFDSARLLPLAALANVLDTVFGATDSKRLGKAYTVLRKHTPSAGALHPIDAYPVVQGVSGLARGLYHYDAAHHRLALLEAMDASQASRFVAAALFGQRYWEHAHCVLLLVARFDRTFWKYREHPKAYKAVLMDAGHLSQTLYLVCSALKLGAFVSAAINDGDIDARLTLDRTREGTVAACGIGIPSAHDAR